MHSTDARGRPAVFDYRRSPTGLVVAGHSLDGRSVPWVGASLRTIAPPRGIRADPSPFPPFAMDAKSYRKNWVR